MIDLDALVGPPPLADGDIYNVPYERPIVEAVDKLLELAKQKGYSKRVETEAHWEVLEQVCNMWATLYPTEFKAFKKFASLQHSNLNNRNATNREGEAIVQHQLEIPRHLHDLILAMFPLQKLTNKKFVAKFSRRFPLMKMTESNL